MAQTIGVIALWWNGRQYPCQKGVQFQRSGKRAQAVATSAGIFHSNEAAAGMAKATLTWRPTDSLANFSPSSGENMLQLKCDTGQIYVCPDAVVQEEPTVQDNGQCPVTWIINQCSEILPS